MLSDFKIITILILFSYGLAAQSLLSDNVLLSENSESSLLGSEETVDIAYAWAGHPAGFDMEAAGDRQFVAFYDQYRQLTLAVRTLPSTNWAFVKLNEFVHPTDSHNYINMAIDRDGYIHLCANMHVAHLNYWRTTNAYDIFSFERLDRMTGELEDRCTYPIFFKDSSGNLLFKYRYGQSGSGNEIINIYDETTKTWSRFNNESSASAAVKSLESEVPLLDGGGVMNAYQSGPVNFGGYYHLAWVWRDTPDCNSNHDVQYARSTDLKNWEDSYGNSFQLPLTITNSETIDPVKIYGGLLNSLKIGRDAQNRCILNYFKFDKDGNTQLYTAKREPAGWKTYQITDWTNRWDFHGGGSIDNMIRNSGVNNSRYGLLCSFRNRFLYENIDYAYILDETTMQPKYAPIRKYPQEITDIQSDVPNMRVNLSGCGSYYLRWETFPNSRDIGDTSDAPTNQMLQMFKLEWNSVTNINKEPYEPVSDRELPYKVFFDGFDFNQDSSPFLISAETNAVNKNYTRAVTDLRKFFAAKSYLIDTNINDSLAAQYKNHSFNFEIEGNSIERTLLFNIDYWNATPENKNYILTNWSVVNSLTLETRQINSTELSEIQPFETIMPKWYYELNRLPHLMYFAKAYAKNQDYYFARMYIHDLENWLCDNPVLTNAAVPSPAWFLEVANYRYENSISNYIPLFAGANTNISDEEFFFLMNADQKHNELCK